MQSSGVYQPIPHHSGYNPNYSQSGSQSPSIQYAQSTNMEGGTMQRTPGTPAGLGSLHPIHAQHRLVDGKLFAMQSAFGSGGYADEPPLFEELGINFSHMKTKSLTVLNPFRPVDKHIMDDTDLAGPLVFFLAFGANLLLSGKVQFGYIYGLAVLGCVSIYAILNLMSESGIDVARTISVLGYCSLPMVLLSFFYALIEIKGVVGFVLSSTSVAWCTYSAATIFVTVLAMKDQRILVAYPVGLLYAAFALLTVF